MNRKAFVWPCCGLTVCHTLSVYMGRIWPISSGPTVCLQAPSTLDIVIFTRHFLFLSAGSLLFCISLGGNYHSLRIINNHRSCDAPTQRPVFVSVAHRIFHVTPLNIVKLSWICKAALPLHLPVS